MSDQPIKNLSRHQYGDLKFIHHNAPSLSYLRKAHASTLSSLAYRGYLRRHGTGDSAVILLTPAGQEALAAYEKATLNERVREGELTERCMRLLQYSRRKQVLEISKKAS